MSFQNVSCWNKLLLCDKTGCLLFVSLSRAAHARSIFHCSLIKFCLLECVPNTQKLTLYKQCWRHYDCQYVFPLQGLTLYPVSLYSISLSGMNVLFGIIFYGSLLMENCWVSTKANSSCNQSESQDWSAGAEFKHNIPTLFLLQLRFCMQGMQTALIKKRANVKISALNY